jgi:PmbA protein
MDAPDYANRLHEAAAAARTELENSTIDRWEFFAKASSTREVEVTPGRQLGVVRVDETGVSVRSWRSGRAGFSAASGLGTQASRKAVEGALATEQPLESDPLPPPRLLGIADGSPRRKLPATGWATHFGSELAQTVNNATGGRLKMRRAIIAEGAYGWVLATADNWVAHHEDTTTTVLVEIDAAGDRFGVWREWLHLSDPEAVDVEAVAEQVTNRAMLTTCPVTTDSGLRDLIIHPEVGAQLLASLAPLFLAGDASDRVLPELLDRHGQLAAPALTVVDDRTDPSAPITGPCDGEGLPSQRTLLLDQGVPRHRLASFRDATRYGDAARGGAVRVSYRDYPATGIANLMIDTSSGIPAAKLLTSAHRALYLLRPLASVLCDPATDSYRIIASGVWLDGTSVRGWHPTVELCGGLGRLLRSIEAVGTDLRWFQTDQGCIGSPSLLVRRQPVVG